MAGKRRGHPAHNRIDPALHILRGTFRADRHGRPASTGPAWEPDPGELAKLGSDGQAFVRRFQAAFDLNPCEGAMLLEAGHSTDRLSEIRARRGTYPPEDIGVSDKLEMRWQKAFVSVMHALRARLV